jgi:hypothetical protein
LPGAAALFAGALLGTRAVVAQSDSPRSGWEYKVFLVDGRDFQDKDDWKQILEKAGGNAFKADADFKEYILNHFANDGWELVQVVQPVKDSKGGSGEIVHFYMKRPRREGEKGPEEGNPAPRKPR